LLESQQQLFSVVWFVSVLQRYILPQLPLSYFRPNADYSTHADNGLIANLFPVFVQIAKSVEAIFPPVRSSTVAFYRSFEDGKMKFFIDAVILTWFNSHVFPSFFTISSVLSGSSLRNNRTEESASFSIVT
jgi:hypothetical protein